MLVVAKVNAIGIPKVSTGNNSLQKVLQYLPIDFGRLIRGSIWKQHRKSFGTYIQNSVVTQTDAEQIDVTHNLHA